MYKKPEQWIINITDIQYLNGRDRAPADQARGGGWGRVWGMVGLFDVHLTLENSVKILLNLFSAI